LRSGGYGTKGMLRGMALSEEDTKKHQREKKTKEKEQTLQASHHQVPANDHTLCPLIEPVAIVQTPRRGHDTRRPQMGPSPAHAMDRSIQPRCRSDRSRLLSIRRTASRNSAQARSVPELLPILPHARSILILRRSLHWRRGFLR
jgi:hypothetical protein